jgi:GNAT superfamily N-acetyltransferase
MNMQTRASPKSKIAPAVIIRPVQPDHLNDVRYIHATAFRSQAHTLYAPEELDAYEAMVRTPGYVDRLMSDTLLGGWLGGQLIATVAWRKAESNPGVGRITALYVRPLFARIGIGSKMLLAMETAAATANCQLASVRTPISSQTFFQRKGYELAGRGTRPLRQGTAINIVFMRKLIGSESDLDMEICTN